MAVSKGSQSDICSDILKINGKFSTGIFVKKKYSKTLCFTIADVCFFFLNGIMQEDMYMCKCKNCSQTCLFFAASTVPYVIKFKFRFLGCVFL